MTQRTETCRNSRVDAGTSYHVGSCEDLLHPMAEALITSFAMGQPEPEPGKDAKKLTLFERA